MKGTSGEDDTLFDSPDVLHPPLVLAAGPAVVQVLDSTQDIETSIETSIGKDIEKDIKKDLEHAECPEAPEAPMVVLARCLLMPG